MDTARRDALEPYGAPDGSSPAVAQLAARGIVQRDLFAASSWTLPSHAAMFTGLLPRACGVPGGPGVRPHDAQPELRGRADRVLAEVLRRDGYATAGVSANVWVAAAGGFDTGFERFAQIDSGRQTILHREDLRARLSWGLEGYRARVDDGAAAVAAILRGWIESAPRDRPFFYFVNLVECHSPYLPPRPYDDLGPFDRVRAAEEARRHLTLLEILRACCGGFEIPSEALERMRHLYARCVRYMDDWLAGILEHLDRRALLDDTLVIVTSDHGENLGEGELITHALSLDDRLLRVPLVAAGPGAPRLVRDEPVSLAELPRLLANAIGLQSHPWLESDLPSDGIVAQIEPVLAEDDPRARATIEEWGLGEEGFRRLTSPRTCATDGRWKLLRFGEQELLFDTSADPLELAPATVSDRSSGASSGNREPGPEAVVGRLRAALDDPSAGVSSQRHADPSSAPIDPEEAQAIEDRMRLLGYL